ncbi:MAG TPA: GntR family transcriptional regulator [Chloroflexota bacterium]|nr:GntR family transcriptional regulator [Chloroflexota bacterium]
MEGPLYRKVQEYLRDGIESGAWPAGAAIPSEKALAAHFSIARMTARQAVDGLIHDGMLVRVHGRGTFVTTPRVERELTRMHGFSEDMRAQGMAPSSRLLLRAVVPAPTEVSEALGLERREAVIVLKRVRLADGTPMAFELSYLRYDLCQSILAADLETGSLYTFLQGCAGVSFRCAAQELRAALPTSAEAAVLEVPRRYPVLVVTQTTFVEGMASDIPAIFGRTLYRGDRYRFRLEVPR